MRAHAHAHAEQVECAADQGVHEFGARGFVVPGDARLAGLVVVVGDEHHVARTRDDPAHAPDRADELGDGVLGRDRVVEQRRIERPASLAREDPPWPRSPRAPPRRSARDEQSGAASSAPVGEDRVVEALIVEGQTAGHLPADPVGQRPCGVAVRESLEGLEDHDRGNGVGRDRGSPALGEEQVLEHLVGEQLVAMVRQERLDAPLGHELSAERRRVEQFTIEFAEPLHVSILDGRSRIRLCEPIYSTGSWSVTFDDEYTGESGNCVFRPPFRCNFTHSLGPVGDVRRRPRRRQRGPRVGGSPQRETRFHTPTRRSPLPRSPDDGPRPWCTRSSSVPPASTTPTCCALVRTSSVLAHRVMAPSTLGTFLRGFTFGHVRQLDRVAETLLTRAWALGAGPGDAPMTIDLDSTICEVHGKQKEGASYGYTKVLGYHPVLATRADTGEVLHLRFRKGSANTQRGAQRFVREVVGRVRRAGASGDLTLRADSGFFSKYVVQACRDHDVRYSITVRQTPAIKRAIEAIAEDDWTGIDYTMNGEAWVGETVYQGQRLIVRRTKLHDPRPVLFPDYRYHAFITDREGDVVSLDADHRRHAVVELAIRDLKEGSGLEHCPSGDFNANGAWAVLASIAHNLVRWVGALGLEITGTTRRQDDPSQVHRAARSPHRTTRDDATLHLPTHWPWATQWSECFARLVKLQT